MDIQDMVNSMNEVGKNQRSGYHLTLGGLIDKLGEGNPSLMVPLSAPHSYRGYYTDLAFEPGETLLGELLSKCKVVLGTTMTGYKGGEFLMDKDVPLWVSEYGCASGIALLDIEIQDGKVELITRYVK